MTTDIRTVRATNFVFFWQTIERAVDHHSMIVWISWLS